MHTCWSAGASTAAMPPPGEAETPLAMVCKNKQHHRIEF